MKFKLKAALAATLALIMALAVMPVSALPRFEAEGTKAEIEPYWTVPAGYNAHDYTKCVQFLEQTDQAGVKNGEKLSDNYDPNDPETWGTYWDAFRFQWTSVAGELRINRVLLAKTYLVGSLDLSCCIALEELDCHWNYLTELNVSNNTALEVLYCYQNNCLTDLNVSNNTALELLDCCQSNSLSSLDVSDCSALVELRCGSNNLSELDVTNNTALELLNCSSSNLSELDVTNNTALEELRCDSNNLSELDVTNNTALEALYCDWNNLSELDVTNNTALELLNCSYSNLSELDVTNNSALRELYCGSNNLSDLDLTQNTALVYLNCNENNLSELNVSNSTALFRLSCSQNNLSELDLSNNPYLPYDAILAAGNGYVGYLYWEYDDDGESYFIRHLYAHPVDNTVFEGFYDENGALISEGEWSDYYEAYCYWFTGQPTGTVIARFSGGAALPGDVDGNGSVSVADAITTLRLAMQLSDGSGMNTDAADMDGNGSITIADAIVILRTAMGLA